MSTLNEPTRRGDEPLVRTLHDTFYSHPNVSAALAVRESIDALINSGKITHESPLTADNLELVRQELYTVTGRMDPIAFLLGPLTGGGKNPIADALDTIERLQRDQMTKS